MGKATIISATGEGLYSVELDLEMSKIDDAISNLQARVTDLEGRLASADSSLSTASAVYIANPTNENLLSYLEAKKRRSHFKLSLAEASLRLSKLQNVPSTIERDAWCADLTEDLAGTVGTMEVPGEKTTVLIRPGYESAAWSADRDGQLVPTLGQTPAQAFYNLAMLPGWQKWLPLHRFGTISEIDTDADTCTVTLDAAASTQQALNVNQGEALSSVPISYMNCNAAAFSDGDSVVVEFEGQSWSSPVVIGFKQGPQSCALNFKVKVNGAFPGEYFGIRLFHPDYGYVENGVINPIEGEPGTYEVYDEQIPGGEDEIDACYVEVERRNYDDYERTSSKSAAWFVQHFNPDLAEVTTMAQIESAGNLTDYDYLMGTLPADQSGTLEDLGEFDRTHVWIYNDGSAGFTVNGVDIDPSKTGHFYWTGTEWTNTDDTADAVVGSPSQRKPEIFQLGGRDYLSVSGDGDGTWTAFIPWRRSAVTVENMPNVDGVHFVSYTVYTIAFFGPASYKKDADVLCSCLGTIDVDTPETFYNADPGAWEQFPSADINFASGSYSTGSCTADIGYLFGDHIIYLSSTTMGVGSIGLISDAFATGEPSFTDFEYALSSFSAVEINQVFDEWWAGSETYCTFGSSLEFTMGEFSKELLPEGEF